jgi:signal transduction histidine kinase
MTGGARMSAPSLDEAPCGMLSFLDDGIITFANGPLRALLGDANLDLAGRHVESILAIGSRIFYQTHLFPLLRLHGRADEIFVLLRATDGTDVGVLLNAIRRMREGQWITDCVLIHVRERSKFEDALLRAKREAEEARALAEEANRAKSTFLTMMSHELRTPLNAIGGYVQLLEMGIQGPTTEAQNEVLDRITKSQRHLLRLINEVINLARIEAGQVQYTLEDVALCDIVDTVLPMVEPQLAARRLRCQVDVPRELVARADREKTEQILLNLLSNASKFTPPDGRVGIAGLPGRESGGHVYLRVQDTGSGIAAAQLPHIFEPFVQVDASPTRRAEGSGLGLAISRDLARGMGGDLRARSEEGVGSAFTLSLPSAVV